MIITSDEQLAELKKIGQICAITLNKMISATRAGMTTKELDELGGKILAEYGAVSAPISEYKFPGYTCISVNEVVAHGIPSDRVLREGDLVNIDVSASLNGYYSDTGYSFFIGKGDKIGLHMLKVSKAALVQAINAAKPGKNVNLIGKAIEDCAHKAGLKTIRNLCGHGIGKSLHESPTMISNYYDTMDRRKIAKGMVLALETFVSEREDFVSQDKKDGWTLRTPKRTRAAQFEHTIVVTDKKPIFLTRLG